MMVTSVHKGIVMLSTKNNLSQTETFFPRCARIYKVVPLGLA